MKTLSEKIIKKCIENDKNDLYQLGRTKLFFRDDLASSLDSFLESVKNEAVLRINRVWKSFKLKKFQKIKIPSIKYLTRKTSSCPSICYNAFSKSIISLDGNANTDSNSSKYTDCKSNFSETSLIEFCLSSKCDLHDSENIQILHTSNSFKIISKRDCIRTNQNKMTLRDCI